MDRRHRLRRLLGIVVAVCVLLVLLLGVVWFFNLGGSSTSAKAPAATSTGTLATPGVDVGCDKGLTGEFKLDESLHGQDGKILNSGATSNEVILEAAKHDPFVLRTLLLDFKSKSKVQDLRNRGQAVDEIQVRDEVDSSLLKIDQLRCLDARRDAWHDLNGIISVSVSSTPTAGDVANRDGFPVNNGTVRVPNAYTNSNGGVSIGISNVPAGEPMVETRLPNGAVVDHRSFCANAVFPGVPIPVPGKGALIVLKKDDHGTYIAGFHIVLEGPITREGVTDSNGRVDFSDLTPGNYTVREIQQPGWVAVTDMKFGVRIDADKVETRVFVNRKEVPSIPTNTPVPGSQPSPTATNTRVPNTPVMPSATPQPEATQTAATRPTVEVCCKTPPPTPEPDFPFPPTPPAPVRTSNPEPTVRPPGPGDNPPPTPRPSGPTSTSIPGLF